MFHSCQRREFLQSMVGAGVAAASLRWSSTFADEATERPPAHTLTVIAGSPRERGTSYGQRFSQEIHDFLENEIVKVCAPHASRQELLAYAEQCGKAIEKFSPAITDELQGIAAGAQLSFEETVLLTLHEETAGHRNSRLPAIQHCTALAAGPPDTADDNTYVGQNWDWMASVYGLSRMLLWQRPEGPSVLAYSYPGLWMGAGLNSAGIALCWTWGDGLGIASPRVGIPAYVLIAQMLYQDSLEAALDEARRARHAGWFCFVLADGQGRLAAVDGTPAQLVVQTPRGHTARASYGCREILGGNSGEPLKLHPQCRRMGDLLEGAKGKLDQAALQNLFGDHESTICKHPGYKSAGGGGGFTVDSMLFNCTTKEAHVQRGPGCSNDWVTFRFAT